MGGAITFAGGEGLLEREREREIFEKNEKRKTESWRVRSMVEEACILFGLFGRWGRRGETHREDA